MVISKVYRSRAVPPRLFQKAYRCRTATAVAVAARQRCGGGGAAMDISGCDTPSRCCRRKYPIKKTPPAFKIAREVRARYCAQLALNSIVLSSLHALKKLS
jgi:hypothetical protein